MSTSENLPARADSEVTIPLPSNLMSGKTAFVTGGGSGVNLGIAMSFARVGANIAICGRSADRLDNAVKMLRETGAEVVRAVADVRDLAAVEHALEVSSDRFGPADVVVCGAAGNFIAPAEELSSNGFKSVVEIDLLGTFHTLRAAFDQLVATRGSVLALSGAQAYSPFAYQAHVGAAKAGVESLIQTLAVEWGRYGIRLNTIVPGPVEDTEGMKRLIEAADEETWTQMIPLGRFATAEEIGTASVLLASDWLKYVTGAQIVVDGGMSLSGTGSFNRIVMSTVDAQRATPGS